MAEGTSVPASDRWVGHHLLLGEPGGSDGLARWAQYGLLRGDQLLYAADEWNSDTAALTATLGRYGVDAADAADEGRLVVVDPARFYEPAGYEQLVDQGLRGHGGVRSVGGPQVAADVLDPTGFAEFEALLDRLWGTQGASALCCYAPAGDEALHEAIRRHPSGWGQHLLHLHHRDGGRWAVHGEIDAANDELFATLLATAAERAAADHGGADRTGADRTGADGAADTPTRASGAPVLVLDCAGLTFSAVAAWRAALAGTAAFRADGGRVALTGLRPHTERMLVVMGLAAEFDVRGGQGGEGR